MNKDNELKKLASKIKQLRIEKGFSQEELAYKCGFDRTYISMLERAKRNPTYFNLLKLADGLNISLVEILNYKSNDTRK